MVAPISAIGSKIITRRSWEIFIWVVLIISPTLSRTHALGFPHGFPPMLLDLVAFSLWPYLLLRNVLLLWLMSTQCLCVQQYPPKSRTCLPFPHLEFSWLCLSTGNPDPLLYPVVYCWSCQFKAAKALVRSEMILHCNIIFYLSAAAGVARLMRSSCVPSISSMLFALWYPSAQVDD